MNILNKINYLLNEKNMSKKYFIKKFLNLEPKFTSTNKIPSESTVYGYLNGSREIKIEFITYIAEVLEVKEQELFESSLEYDNEYNYIKTKEVRSIIDLLKYLPSIKIRELHEQLREYKMLYDKRL